MNKAKPYLDHSISLLTNNWKEISVITEFQPSSHKGQKVANFDPNWAFLDCNYEFFTLLLMTKFTCWHYSLFSVFIFSHYCCWQSLHVGIILFFSVFMIYRELILCTWLENWLRSWGHHITPAWQTSSWICQMNINFINFMCFWSRDANQVIRIGIMFVCCQNSYHWSVINEIKQCFLS